jgi:hypothetical protein
MLRLIPLWLALWSGDPNDSPARFDAAALESFEKEVRPILATRCQSCHGAQKQKGGLRLDSRAAVLAGGDTGPALVPGKPSESRLVEAINYSEDLKMPPRSKLPAAEVDTLTRWVAAGAPWPDADRPKTSGAADNSGWKERAKHWSLQPVRRVDPPTVREPAWPFNPVDQFLLAEIDKAGLKPAADADRRSWIRRVTFDLTGLPPRPEDVDIFIADKAQDAFERVVDRLLASPRYGERWGRHWLDLVRFAETSGHEFDYDIPDAWRYRDYVIRAFNADVPFDHFVIEHLAGDLLPNPRRNLADGSNESILATGFFFLGEGTHSPVDLRDDEAIRVDNQVDVLGKAFLGATLACARCHDHKFDAITARDYYALTGYLKSSRPQHAFLDMPERIGGKVRELETIKAEFNRRGVKPKATEPTVQNDGSTVFEDFRKGTFDGWFATGDAFGSRPSRSGDMRINALATPSAEAVAPGFAHSGLVSDRLQGVLRSRTFVIDRPSIHYLAAGRGSRINLVVDGFEKIRSPIYGGLTLDVESPERPRWYSMDVAMWRGHRAYIELSDGATIDYTGGSSHYGNGDGFLAVAQIRFSDGGPPGIKTEEPGKIPLNDSAWEPLLKRYREVGSSIPAPTLGLAITDGNGEDTRVNVRGNPRTPGEVAPRRFLEVLGGVDRTTPEPGSGRLELARRIVDPTNPLTARVLVNRLWKHHFGEGLVRTPDDFGKMGQTPSHPELLDWLASEFVRDGWSIKRMQRLLVLSHAYRMGSSAQPEADRVDPSNRLLHRMNVRRLDAEAVRDTMLAVSGRLDTTMFGPSVPTHLTPFMEGRGRPGASGPLDGAGRRSVYLNVRRNFLSPLLLAFDFPAPASCIGRRNVSNVPAQALTLLNDPFVLDQARRWADRALARDASPTGRLDNLYRDAFGRLPTARERAESLAFLEKQGMSNPQSWADLCHVLFNAKEFLFIP